AGRSLTHALVPQPVQPSTSTTVSTCTRIGWPGRSSTPRTVMSGSPTTSAHMRVALVSTGAPEARRCRNHRFSEPLCRARWTPLYAVTPRPDPKRRLLPAVGPASAAGACGVQAADHEVEALQRRLLAGEVATGLDRS